MTMKLTCREYTQIIDTAPDAILLSDREGLIQLWNEGAEHIFGYSHAEAMGQSLDIIIPPRLRERHWEGYYRAIETGEFRYGKYELLSVPAMCKDGSQISCAFSMIILRDEDNKIIGMASILRDGTKAWNKEKELKQQIAELKKEQP
ncbi:MAG: PAS domain S-box protein [Desulfuromonadaceae bacterium]|nr:PAS domain S-box protein [Desulfuromonas sp.]MDY0213458.1 PAS domain S-box protein [Desulfuromonadaceae bacterium]